MMRYVIQFVLVCCFALLIYTQTNAAENAPKYSSPNTKIIIEKMIKAHGGMKKWNNSSSFSFTSVLVFGKPLSTEFWISRETTEIKTERTYQTWLTFGGKLANDGTKTWTENWQLGNPPTVNVNSIYYAVALPWLTQRPDVVLKELAESRLFKKSDFYKVVKMTFKPGSKKSPYKYYRLYIDKKTNLLKGIDYNVTYGAFLDLVKAPKDKTSIGPITHAIYTYKKVKGLVFPEKFDTFGVERQDYGRHIVYGHSLDTEFDNNRMTISNRAVIDKSSRKRNQ